MVNNALIITRTPKNFNHPRVEGKIKPGIETTKAKKTKPAFTMAAGE